MGGNFSSYLGLSLPARNFRISALTFWSSVVLACWSSSSARSWPCSLSRVSSIASISGFILASRRKWSRGIPTDSTALERSRWVMKALRIFSWSSGIFCGSLIIYIGV